MHCRETHLSLPNCKWLLNVSSQLYMLLQWGAIYWPCASTQLLQQTTAGLISACTAGLPVTIARCLSSPSAPVFWLLLKACSVCGHRPHTVGSLGPKPVTSITACLMLDAYCKLQGDLQAAEAQQKADKAEKAASRRVALLTTNLAPVSRDLAAGLSCSSPFVLHYTSLWHHPFCVVCLWTGSPFQTASCARRLQLQRGNMRPHWPES